MTTEQELKAKIIKLTGKEEVELRLLVKTALNSTDLETFKVWLNAIPSNMVLKVMRKDYGMEAMLAGN